MTVDLTMPTDPTQLPAGPDRIEVEPLHLSNTKRWNHGGSQNIHLLENGDLGVILKRGGGGDGMQCVRHDAETGTVIITLGVDGDHDEVHYTHRGSEVDVVELLGQAVETPVACRYAAMRSGRDVDLDEKNAFTLGRDYERGQQSS